MFIYENVNKKNVIPLPGQIGPECIRRVKKNNEKHTYIKFKT